jgi:hypothetical protein
MHKAVTRARTVVTSSPFLGRVGTLRGLAELSPNHALFPLRWPPPTCGEVDVRRPKVPQAGSAERRKNLKVTAFGPWGHGKGQGPQMAES